MEDLVAVERVAELAEVNVRTVQRWIAEAGIKTYSRGDRRRRFLHLDDAQFLLRPRTVQRQSTAEIAQAGV
jgi:DNA-binding transcriptional MerR regulator